MDLSQLRVAITTGNYNMVRDGPTQALNRLVDYLLSHGAAVRIFAPTVENPQVDEVGELISVPSFPIPGRSEYRVPLGLVGEARHKFEEFRPNIVHVAAPDRASRHAAKWARDRGIPVLGSVHTRFETYPQYYHLGFLEPLVEIWLRRLYHRCDALVAPSDGMVDVLRQQRMHTDIGIWSRGVDRTMFHSGAREMARRRDLGIADDEIAIGYLGRIVMEKGLPEFADTMKELTRRGVPVVAARATGATTLVKDGETGTLIEPGAIGAYADALQHYIEDPVLRAAHGAAGEARSKLFSWDAINRSMAETYLRLVAARSA
jgi:phosphatidylinositol alpha 1,6-mannosyltransferase